MKTILALSAATIALSMPSTTRAEEQLSRRLIQNGIICDFAESVIEHIAAEGKTAPADCGRLTQPMWADVYLTEIYEAHGYRFMLARYEFPMAQADGTVEIWVQYGYWGAPRPIPASFDIPAWTPAQTGNH